jgi:predicted patatin/cPLA2 family phospholipase
MKEQIDYLRASASLPYLSKIVEIDGKKYLDGGCTDCIPVEAFMEMGFERNVVVLTRPSDYVRGPASRPMTKLFYNKYPAFMKAMEERHERYNKTIKKIAELESEGKIFVIRPEVDVNIGRLEKDPVEIQRVYDIGRRDGEKYVNAIKEWLNK